MWQVPASENCDFASSISDCRMLCFQCGLHALHGVAEAVTLMFLPPYLSYDVLTVFCLCILVELWCTLHDLTEVLVCTYFGIAVAFMLTLSQSLTVNRASARIRNSPTAIVNLPCMSAGMKLRSFFLRELLMIQTAFFAEAHVNLWPNQLLRCCGHAVAYM